MAWLTARYPCSFRSAPTNDGSIGGTPSRLDPSAGLACDVVRKFHSPLFGYRNYETNDNSRNNALVAIIASGEGWHNNHHADPNSASNQRHSWEIDLTYLLLRLLLLLGLAWDVQLPKRSISPGV